MKESKVMATLSSFFSGLGERFTAWRERERAFAELSALDDRTLADLGLRRADIPFVVYCKARATPDTTLAGTRAVVPANGNNGLRAA
jgi:uncharacterized protein YjiS (DUF1127 family)